MSIRRAKEADADYPTRVTHQVDGPDRFTSWRDYAFSDAPELADAASDSTPMRGIPTV